MYFLIFNFLYYLDLSTLSYPVILFDGVCNLCSGAVQFVVKYDPKHQFRFASLQSELGKQILAEYKLNTPDIDSIILWEEGKVSIKSTAALKIAKKLNGLLPILYGFIIIPTFLRNAVYDWVAKNRYKWFGKKEVCWIPSKELSALFLD